MPAYRPKLSTTRFRQTIPIVPVTFHTTDQYFSVDRNFSGKISRTGFLILYSKYHLIVGCIATTVALYPNSAILELNAIVSHEIRPEYKILLRVPSHHFNKQLQIVPEEGYALHPASPELILSYEVSQQLPITFRLNTHFTCTYEALCTVFDTILSSYYTTITYTPRSLPMVASAEEVLEDWMLDESTALLAEQAY
ncbi:hypothetical protein NM688_g3 [Phlebia brevispora]|uniref:Uncharacterized protein n=1 Tax=Phlebia brevispora TaxID=194682 RepID=A0ACC1TF96_9APHY|nr:hypothetical protein NM688_g3 [Phlebia brevispora]